MRYLLPLRTRMHYLLPATKCYLLATCYLARGCYVVPARMSYLPPATYCLHYLLPLNYVLLLLLSATCYLVNATSYGEPSATFQVLP